jgi:hypothetical protein
MSLESKLRHALWKASEKVDPYFKKQFKSSVELVAKLSSFDMETVLMSLNTDTLYFPRYYEARGEPYKSNVPRNDHLYFKLAIQTLIKHPNKDPRLLPLRRDVFLKAASSSYELPKDRMFYVPFQSIEDIFEDLSKLNPDSQVQMGLVTDYFEALHAKYTLGSATELFAAISRVKDTSTSSIKLLRGYLSGAVEGKYEFHSHLPRIISLFDNPPEIVESYLRNNLTAWSIGHVEVSTFLGLMDYTKPSSLAFVDNILSPEIFQRINGRKMIPSDELFFLPKKEGSLADMKSLFQAVVDSDFDDKNANWLGFWYSAVGLFHEDKELCWLSKADYVRDPDDESSKKTDQYHIQKNEANNALLSRKRRRLIELLNGNKEGTGCQNLPDLIDIVKTVSVDKIVRQLGKGKFGTVYLVHSPEMNLYRAMKVLNAVPENKVEVETLSHIRANPHRNLPRMDDAGTHIAKFEDYLGERSEDRYAILMEYVDGDTLDKVFSKNPNGMNSDVAIDYSSQLLSGISYIRSMGRKHCDLWLKNIKINTEGVLKILDFGTITSDLAKEVPFNRRYGGSSDIFSWALLSYEMFTGHHLITDRLQDDTSETYASRIHEMKKSMRNEDGSLKQEYVDKIHANIPESVAGFIVDAVGYVEPEKDLELIARIQNGLEDTAKYEKKRKEVEAAIGRSLDKDQYNALRRIFEGK